MRKVLAALACVLVLAGCSRTVQGQAVVEDARAEQSAPRTTSAAPSPVPSIAPRASADDGAAFDPCALDDIFLSIAVGVDPATKVERSDGCQWSGEGVQFVSALANDVSMELLPSTEGVTDLEEVVQGEHVAQIFVFEGNKCVSLFEQDGATVQFMLMEDYFSTSCFSLSVVTRMYLMNR